MITSHHFPAAFAVLLLLLYGIVKILRIGRREPGLPPGPPTVPILGNLHLMPTDRPHLQFQKWAQEYGPMYSLICGTKTIIVLSRDTIVKDLLEKRSGIYSDRPDMFIGQKIASGNLRLVVMRYGNNWRMIHKMIHNILNIKAAVTYIPYQDLENKFLLASVLNTPNEFLKHIRRFSYSLSTQMIFGYRCPEYTDPQLQELFVNFENWGKLSGSSSAQLSDIFPIAQKLPDWIAPDVRYARKLHEREKKHYVGHWMRAKRGLDDGTGLPCFCNDIYRAQKTEGFSDDAAGYISGSLLEAGSDTTSSTLFAFILAMILWPDVQRKVQEEIERVVGPDRLPVIEDYENLPYVRCCIKESLRWMPTVVMGVPHSVLKDDTYMGYRIPKGATVINNVWAIHMDPNRSPEPRRFNPDRFRDDHTSLYQSAIGDSTKRDNFVFGAGRRLCQGIHIAERSLFLGISRLVWAFDFRPAPDFKYDIEDLVGGITIQPANYPAIITPRSEKRAQIIKEEEAACNEKLHPKTKQWLAAPEGMLFSTWTPEKTED